MKPRHPRPASATAVASLLRATAALCATTALGAAPALAEISPHELAHPVDESGLGPGYGRRDLQFHLDVGTYFATLTGANGVDEDRLGISPLLRVMQPVGFNEVELSWGFIWLDTRYDGSEATTFQVGNVYAAHYWVWRTLARQIRLGLGAGAPTAILRDEQPLQTAIDNQALIVAAGMRGARDYWLWAPETLSGVLHFDFYQRWPFGLVLGGQVIAANLYGFSEEPSTEALGLTGYNLVGQVDAEVAFDTRPVRSALRASYVIVPLNEGERGWLGPDEIDQINVEAEFRIRLGRADVVLRMDVPIDAPFGFAFGDEGVWGAHIGVSSPTELRLPEAN